MASCAGAGLNRREFLASVASVVGALVGYDPSRLAVRRHREAIGLEVERIHTRLGTLVLVRHELLKGGGGR